MLLKPIKMPDEQEGEIERGSDSPLIACDACGTSKPSHDMIGFAINVPVPGHPDLYSIGCEQHWACSIACVARVGHACIDEHVVPLLEFHHKKVGIL
jgi:hypothetical protein